MSGKDVDRFMTFLDDMIIEGITYSGKLYFEASFWKSWFEEALHQSTSQPIYRKQERS